MLDDFAGAAENTLAGFLPLLLLWLDPLLMGAAVRLLLPFPNAPVDLSPLRLSAKEELVDFSSAVGVAEIFLIVGLTSSFLYLLLLVLELILALDDGGG
jgi:hypothetical protein